MDKIDILVDIGNILGEWAFLAGVDENPETREFIEHVLIMLSNKKQCCLEEIKNRLLSGKQAKALRQSINNLIQENES